MKLFYSSIVEIFSHFFLHAHYHLLSLHSQLLPHWSFNFPLTPNSIHTNLQHISPSASIFPLFLRLYLHLLHSSPPKPRGCCFLASIPADLSHHCYPLQHPSPSPQWLFDRGERAQWRGWPHTHTPPRADTLDNARTYSTISNTRTTCGWVKTQLQT